MDPDVEALDATFAHDTNNEYLQKGPPHLTMFKTNIVISSTHLLLGLKKKPIKVTLANVRKFSDLWHGLIQKPPAIIVFNYCR